MRKIEVGEMELRVVRKLLEEVEHGLPRSHLNAHQKRALRTFLRRLSLCDTTTVE